MGGVASSFSYVGIRDEYAERRRQADVGGDELAFLFGMDGGLTVDIGHACFLFAMLRRPVWC